MPDLEVRIRLSIDKQTLSFSVRSHILRLQEEEQGTTVLNMPPAPYMVQLFQEFERTDLLSHNPGVGDIHLASLGRSLFWLMPEPLRGLLWKERDKLKTIQILSDEPWIPWELAKLEMKTPMGTQEGLFFAEQFAISRWFRGPLAPEFLSLDHVALVTPKGKGLGAFVPAINTLRYMLNQKGRTTEIPASVPAVLNAMARGDHDAWYFFGHGGSDENPSLSRFDLERGDRLMPVHISGKAANLGHDKRPLVFLNSCRGGRTDFDLTGVGGWAVKFHEAGAGAFVGAYWSVPAEVAARFANIFFAFLIDGETVAHAFQKARLAIKTPGDPTWLAFTLIAAPHARLRMQEQPITMVETLEKQTSGDLKKANPFPPQDLPGRIQLRPKIAILFLLVLLLIAWRVQYILKVEEVKPVRVAFLDFFDWQRKMPLPFTDTAVTYRNAFQSKLVQISGDPLVLADNCDTLNTSDNVEHLLEILYDPGETQGQKVLKASTALLDSYDVDVLVSGYLIDSDPNDGYAELRPFAIFRENQMWLPASMNIDLTYEQVAEGYSLDQTRLSQESQETITRLTDRFFEEIAAQVKLIRWQAAFLTARAHFDMSGMQNAFDRYAEVFPDANILDDWAREMAALSPPFSVYSIPMLEKNPFSDQINGALDKGISTFLEEFPKPVFQKSNRLQLPRNHKIQRLLTGPNQTHAEKSRIVATILHQYNIDFLVSGCYTRKAGKVTFSLLLFSRYHGRSHQRVLAFDETGFICEDTGKLEGEDRDVLCNSAAKKIAEIVAVMLNTETKPLMRTHR